LFTGDHVLEGVSPVILPPDGDMSAYLRLARQAAAYDFERIAPGHGGIMQRGKEVLPRCAHTAWRARQGIAQPAARAAATIDELTPVVYDDVAVPSATAGRA
jgi:glyoxylase-like metal-dependent hydrolase (beta-lactamase superfamily II)